LVYAPLRSLLNEHPLDVQQPARSRQVKRNFQFLASIAFGSLRTREWNSWNGLYWTLEIRIQIGV